MIPGKPFVLVMIYSAGPIGDLYSPFFENRLGRKQQIIELPFRITKPKFYVSHGKEISDEIFVGTEQREDLNNSTLKAFRSLRRVHLLEKVIHGFLIDAYDALSWLVHIKNDRHDQCERNCQAKTGSHAAGAQ